MSAHTQILERILGAHYSKRLREPVGLSNYQFMIGPVLTGVVTEVLSRVAGERAGKGETGSIGGDGK